MGLGDPVGLGGRELPVGGGRGVPGKNVDINLTQEKIVLIK